MAKIGSGKRKMDTVRKKQSAQTMKSLKGFVSIFKPKKKRKKRKLF